jgi:drug/metabolite transporter (DMT)-like permease
MHLTPRLVGLLTLPPLLWASNAVLGRMIVPMVPPLALNALRWLGALLVLAVLGWRSVASPQARSDVWARTPYLALLGLLGIGAYNALQYLALLTSTPINVTLIAASMPVFMMLVGALLFGVWPVRQQLIGTLFSMCGVLMAGNARGTGPSSCWCNCCSAWCGPAARRAGNTWWHHARSSGSPPCWRPWCSSPSAPRWWRIGSGVRAWPWAAQRWQQSSATSRPCLPLYFRP